MEKKDYYDELCSKSKDEYVPLTIFEPLCHIAFQIFVEVFGIIGNNPRGSLLFAFLHSYFFHSFKMLTHLLNYLGENVVLYYQGLRRKYTKLSGQLKKNLVKNLESFLSSPRKLQFATSLTAKEHTEEGTTVNTGRLWLGLKTY